MYCGNIVEIAPALQLFAHPQHPYTEGLLKSIPRIRKTKLARLPIIQGMVPDLLNLPAGCPFADRCGNVQNDCREVSPQIKKTNSNSWVACHFPVEGSSPVKTGNIPSLVTSEAAEATEFFTENPKGQQI
jgi:oligopeptide/dipeptide ABC transporter ATP-binding protein